MEYFCTHSAHDPESLTQHMNHMAHRGWDLLAVDYAVRGESGYHTFFWRRPVGGGGAGEHGFRPPPAAPAHG
jgi:hypothetical protein